MNRFLTDKYYYHRPSISPYLNMSRPYSGDIGTSYQHYVRPEQQRREAFDQAKRDYYQERKRQGNIGWTDYGLANQVQGTVPNVRSMPHPSMGPSSNTGMKNTLQYQQYYRKR